MSNIIFKIHVKYIYIYTIFINLSLLLYFFVICHKSVLDSRGDAEGQREGVFVVTVMNL